MRPSRTAEHYDQIAEWWRNRHSGSEYGLAQLSRAIAFTKHRGSALDVGCGSSGRFLEALTRAGFTPEGLDHSPEMIRLARERHPHLTFHSGEISSWTASRRYDLVCAWDSTFHLPLELQEPALRNMVEALEPGGILLFTFGGGDGPGEISGSFAGQDFDYSTLGESQYLALVSEMDCTCLHLEYDQGPDERHVYLIARKGRTSNPTTSIQS